jgi:putative endonuclease
MSNRSSTIYIGVTNNLGGRVTNHKEKVIDSFTKRYAINRLVYFKVTESIETALNREKQLKGWTRAKKIALIESVNSEWKDLSAEFMDTADCEEINEKPVIKRGTVNQYRKIR